MADAFFRAGIGAVVIDEARRILVLKRKGVSEAAWQLPQGGIGFDETPIAALYRELSEETGLAAADIEVVRDTGDWWIYEVPIGHRNAKVGWGQAQRWFLCRLVGSPAGVKPDQVEFSEAEWVDGETLLARAVDFRVPVYRRIRQAFDL